MMTDEDDSRGANSRQQNIRKGSAPFHERPLPTRAGAALSTRNIFVAVAGVCLIVMLVTRFDAASYRTEVKMSGGARVVVDAAPVTLREDAVSRSVSAAEWRNGAKRRLIGADGIEAIWEGPATVNAKGELEEALPTAGVLLVLHGCQHSAKDFFVKNADCAECRGLAQEIMITRTALERGYSVIAISSHGTCWRKDIDVPRVKAALDAFFRETGLGYLPLFGFGASSGGMFVGLLPQMGIKPEASGLLIQIAPGPKLPSAGLAKYPPTVFSHMPRDVRTAEFVATSVSNFREVGVPVIESRMEIRAIDDVYFHEHSSEKITKEESAGMKAALRSLDLLDAEGILTRDPRTFSQRQVDMIRQHGPKWDTLVPDESDVRELLNVAYATHELSAQDFGEHLEWLKRTHEELGQAGK